MIDLHTHTKGSDGDKTPQELIDLAINRGIEALAITDHDTTDSIETAINYAMGRKILLIPGVEFAAKVDKGQMHILGLFIDYQNEELKQKLLFMKNERESRNAKFIEEFNKLGFQITLEELKNVSNGKIIGKPHFAKVFLQKGYIKEKEEIFRDYFNKSPFKEIKRTMYTSKEIIETIKKTNGIAVLAHPQSLKLEENELVKTIKELKNYGLDGLECYHSNQTLEEMNEFKKIANEYDLIITKGSDYHGPITKPEIELGTGKENNIAIADDNKILEKLLQMKDNIL